MPPLIRQDDLLLRLIKDVNDIQQALRRVVANLPLYDVSNENTPAQITADANDYVPGNFDVLRLSTDAPRTITGFRGGVKGRFLTLFNVGAFEITIANLSGLSILGDRVYSPTTTDIILNAGGQLVLYYDITNNQWISSYATNADRKSVELRLLVAQSLANATYDQISWTSVISDTGGFFNAGTPTYITIPETGWYEIHVHTEFDPSAGGGLRESYAEKAIALPWQNLLLDSRVAVTGASTNISMDRQVHLLKGEKVYVTVWQNSAGPLNVNPTGPRGSYTTLIATKM